MLNLVGIQAYTSLFVWSRAEQTPVLGIPSDKPMILWPDSPSRDFLREPKAEGFDANR